MEIGAFFIDLKAITLPWQKHEVFGVGVIVSGFWIFDDDDSNVESLNDRNISTIELLAILVDLDELRLLGDGNIVIFIRGAKEVKFDRDEEDEPWGGSFIFFPHFGESIFDGFDID